MLAHAGIALLAAAGLAHVKPQAPVATCPQGAPVQMVTVANQAHVKPRELARVERATTDQSLQIRAAWGTPCVEFGPGGWVLTLSSAGVTHNSDGSTSMTTSGRHCGPEGTTRWTCYSAAPTLEVDTAGLGSRVWARAFTHEVAEALVDPTDNVQWAEGLVEIDDPVENETYPLDGVQVSDFAYPSYFQGGAGPYDRMGALTAPAGA